VRTVYAVKPAMPRSRSLSRETIAAAAIAVIDRDGLPALSMRSVAAELEVGTMSLYRYVDSREALEAMTIDHVVSGLDLEVRRRSSWSARVTTLVARARAAIGSHPGAIPLVLTCTASIPGLQRWAEAVLAALADGGFEGKRRVLAFRTLNKYLLGSIQVEHFGAITGSRTAALASLPPSEFPRLTETARFAMGVTAEEEFRGGLAIVLSGLAREVAEF
jgi:AcrR family transcriptional regulator